MIEITALSSSSKGNCYRVTDGKTPLLLECGINFKQMQKGFQYKISQFAGCLVSHEHGDHCKAIKDVLQAGIDCYMSPGTAGAIGISHHRIKPVRAKQLFKVGSWSIMPFDVQHDVAEVYGFLLANEDGDKLLFATDTYYIKYKFRTHSHYGGMQLLE